MSWITDFLTWWVVQVTRRAWTTLFLLTLSTLVFSWIAVTQFRINSDLGDLIDQSASWRVDFDQFEAKFPFLVRTAVVVVSSASLQQLETATQEIVAYLQARPQMFSEVSAPGGEAFFRDHAFLYMDLDTLDDTTDQLAQAQPWLSAVADDPSLRGVLRLVAQGLDNNPPAGFDRVLQLLSRSAKQTLAGKEATIRWTDELFESSETRYQLIYLQPKSSFTETLPDAQVMAELRTMVRELNFPDSVQVKLTGELALQHEEIEAAVSGVSLAGWLALALLFAVMVIGVRSVKIIIATFALLIIGVVWTSAYAMLTVGEYNTLSLVFVVMFFGLAVDFALHFSLRFQEATNRGNTHVAQALTSSTASVGRAISLCTLTTALGFLGFYPTQYQGLADLGVISAGGMVIAWFLTFTLLPAFYQVCGAPRAHEMDLPTSERMVTWLTGHRRYVIGAVVLVAVTSAYWASQMRFDYSVLALKDPEAESMQTLRVLQSEGLSTDYQLVVLKDEPVQRDQLEQLEVVNEVRSPQDWVPQAQQDKLYVVEDIQQLLWSALNADTPQQAPHPQALRLRAQEVLSNLDARRLSGHSMDDVAETTLNEFRLQMMAMIHASDEQWLTWQAAVIDNLLEELAWLQRATAIDKITLDDLPLSIRKRLVAASGEQLTVITPSQDIADLDVLSAFIEEVRAIEPNATGRPVIEWGVGQIVVDSFLQAMVYALTAILVVLLFALRHPLAVLMILLPLLLAAGMTLALGVLLDLPINMANILVIPLIFGLGVDNGIHVVDRYLGEGDVDHLMHSSTPRAVLLSTLTTVGAFAALSISPHTGTASIGLLLSIAVSLLLMITVFVLPVLLSAVRPKG